MRQDRGPSGRNGLRRAAWALASLLALAAACIAAIESVTKSSLSSDLLYLPGIYRDLFDLQFRTGATA